MKCPDGLSPRNSLNHDSCSISSFSIARERSYEWWSLPAVMLQMCVYPATVHRSAFARHSMSHSPVPYVQSKRPRTH